MEGQGDREWPVEVVTLPNRMRIVYEHIPSATSVHFAFWVRAGSQYETPEQAGLAHFLEHLFFKGTPRRTAVEIVRSIEASGGSIHAFTDKEYACFYLHVLPQFLEPAVDVVCDMLQNALLAPEDIEREKGVVLEEIRRAEDTPEELVEELYEQACWGEHPLGRSVLGRWETVRRFERNLLQTFRERLYRPDRFLVAVVGRFEVEALIRQLGEAWGRVVSPDGLQEPPPPIFHARSTAVNRDTEQVQIALGFPACGEANPDSYALSLLETYLGGGMSSRLFQEIRERRGWAYVIATDLIQYRQAGTFLVSLGTSLDNAPRALELIRREIERVLEKGIPARRLEQTKQQVEGQLLLGLETPGAHAEWLAWSMLTFGRVVSVGEVVERYRAVEPETVLEVARRYLSHPPSLASVGQKTAERVEEWRTLVTPDTALPVSGSATP